MVTVGVSRMGKTNVIFINPGAKVNSSYYCEVVLGRACCLISKQDVVITDGHFSRTARQRTRPVLP